MKVFDFEKVEAYKVAESNYTYDVCDCGGKIELYIDDLEISISEKKILLKSSPVLICKNCRDSFLPQYTKKAIRYLYKELVDKDLCQVVSSPTGYREKYNYCEKAAFIYDHRDYESIPGLATDFEHSEKGFLTPVFFRKDALLYFINSPEYEVNLFSESYGNIGRYSYDGYYMWEWQIPLGFNTNGRLVLWLGDLDGIDEISQSILKPFNIESDHLLTDSEFYDAQMKCIFSEPIIETQICQLKKEFIKQANKVYGINIEHLVEECKEQENKIQRPIVFDERNVQATFSILDQLLIEGFNIKELKTLYELITIEDERVKGYKEWKSIKLLDAIQQLLAYKKGIELKGNLIGSLYVLHDFRNQSDHLFSFPEREKYRANIVNTLGISSFDQMEQLYFNEMDMLKRLLQNLLLLIG